MKPPDLGTDYEGPVPAVDTLDGFGALPASDQDELRKFGRYLKRRSDGTKQQTAHYEVYEGIVYGQLVAAAAGAKEGT